MSKNNSGKLKLKVYQIGIAQGLHLAKPTENDSHFTMLNVYLL